MGGGGEGIGGGGWWLSPLPTHSGNGGGDGGEGGGGGGDEDGVDRTAVEVGDSASELALTEHPERSFNAAGHVTCVRRRNERLQNQACTPSSGICGRAIR